MAITSATGTFTHGSTISVGGSGFGSKATAAPVKWDGFDGAVNDTLESRGFLVDVKPLSPRLDNVHLRGTPGNTTTARCPHAVNNTGGFWYGTGCTDLSYTAGSAANEVTLPGEWIFIVWMYYQKATDSSNYNLKFLRHHGTTQPDNGYWSFPNSNSDGGNHGGPAGSDASSSGELIGTEFTPDTDFDGQWVRLRGRFSQTADVYALYINNLLHVSNTGWTPNFQRNMLFETQMLLSPSGNDNDGTGEVHWDDFYCDDTQARIEIGNHATYASATHCEVQIPSGSWSNTACQFTLNRGTFGATDSAWLYVIDANGTASAGFAITFGDAAETSGRVPFRRA